MIGDTPEMQQSEFSSDFACLYRVDRALRAANRAYIQEDVVLYFHYLNVLKRECIYKMAHKKFRETGKCKEDCPRCDIEKRFIKLSRSVISFKNLQNVSVKMNLLLDLDKAELELRDFMHKKGMLLRDADDARTALARG